MVGWSASKGTKWHNLATNWSIFILKLALEFSQQYLSGHSDIFYFEVFPTIWALGIVYYKYRTKQTIVIFI